MSTAAKVRAALREVARPEKKAGAERFFKCGPGEYGEGDVFIGVTVPEQRRIAKSFRGIPLKQIETLLRSKIHEERLTALILLTDSYARGDATTKLAIVRLYLANTKHVNNWDLVDTSAAQILGAHLLDKPRAQLRKLAKSKSLWERRIAIIATYAFINAGEYKDTFELSQMLLNDKEDLMHKAVGWMLREVGKRVGVGHLRTFLREHAHEMPRTALRYAIEHLSASEKQKFMKQK